MDPAPQQVGVDTVSHRHSGHGDARLLRGLHRLRLELGAVNSPTAAWRCLVHSAYVPHQVVDGYEHPRAPSADQHDFAGRLPQIYFR